MRRGANPLGRNLSQRGCERRVPHLLNLTGAGFWLAPMEDIIPVGPVAVSVRDSLRSAHRVVTWCVGGGASRVVPRDGWLHFTLPMVREHEMAVFE